MLEIWYDCPVCGSEKCTDGEHFCHKCEMIFRKNQEDREEFRTETELHQYFALLNQ